MTPFGIANGFVIEVGARIARSWQRPVAQSFDGTITPNFAMGPGLSLQAMGFSFIAADDVASVSENVFLTTPCTATVIGDGGGNASCQLPALASLGTITLRLSIHSDAVCAEWEIDSGHVGPGEVFLQQKQVPEPLLYPFLLGQGSHYWFTEAAVASADTSKSSATLLTSISAWSR